MQRNIPMPPPVPKRRSVSHNKVSDKQTATPFSGENYESIVEDESLPNLNGGVELSSPNEDLVEIEEPATQPEELPTLLEESHPVETPQIFEQQTEDSLAVDDDDLDRLLGLDTVDVTVERKESDVRLSPEVTESSLTGYNLDEGETVGETENNPLEELTGVTKEELAIEEELTQHLLDEEPDINEQDWFIEELSEAESELAEVDDKDIDKAIFESLTEEEKKMFFSLGEEPKGDSHPEGESLEGDISDEELIKYAQENNLLEEESLEEFGLDSGAREEVTNESTTKDYEIPSYQHEEEDYLGDSEPSYNTTEETRDKEDGSTVTQKGKSNSQKGLKGKFSLIAQQVKAELNGEPVPTSLQEEEAEETEKDNFAPPKEKKDKERKPSSRGKSKGGGRLPSFRLPRFRGIKSVVGLYNRTAKYSLAFVLKVLSILSAIPIVGKIFKPILAATRLLELVTKIIPGFFILAGALSFYYFTAPFYTFSSLPDNGSAVTHIKSYKDNTVVASVKNTGDISADLVPTFYIKGFKPTLNPLTWVTTTVVGECSHEVITLEPGETYEVVTECHPQEKSLLPRATGELE